MARQTRADLLAIIAGLRRDAVAHAHALQLERIKTMSEQTKRMAAQVPLIDNYVRPLEQFATWLKGQPTASRHEIIDKLTELWLWDIKVGYDPRKDLDATVVSVQRMRA